MITALFIVLSGIAIIGAVGALLCRRVTNCLYAFLACGGAVGGLLLLLDLQVAAVVQFTLCVLVVGTSLALLPPGSRTGDGGPSGERWWPLAAVVAVGVPLMWSVARGSVGEPVLGAPPMWAIHKSHLAALGEEWVGRHTVLLLLLGVLLLVGIVGAARLKD